MERKNTETWKDSEVIYVGPASALPKTVTVKINIDKEGRFFLDENGKEVVMLDADENYIKKISTESKKVQEILKLYYQD